MKTILLLNGRKTTRKEVLERLPETTLNRLIKDAKESFKEEPDAENEFMVPGVVLTISFE